MCSIFLNRNSNSRNSDTGCCKQDNELNFTLPFQLYNEKNKVNRSDSYNSNLSFNGHNDKTSKLNSAASVKPLLDKKVQKNSGFLSINQALFYDICHDTNGMSVDDKKYEKSFKSSFTRTNTDTLPPWIKESDQCFKHCSEESQ